MPLFIPETWAHPGHIAGGVYPAFATVGTAAAPAAVDVIYFLPVFFDAPLILKTLGVRVVAAGAGSSFKAALWRNNPATMRPTGVPLTSNNAGAATTSANATVLATVTDLSVPARTLAWIGAKWTGTLPTMLVLGANSTGNVQLIGTGLVSGVNAQVQGFSAPDAYANDIAVFDATGATLTNATQATPLPNYVYGA